MLFWHIFSKSAISLKILQTKDDIESEHVMILPTKKLRPENSLIFIGGEVLKCLDQPKTISNVWNSLKSKSRETSSLKVLNYTFDWYVLTLDFLYAINAIEVSDGVLSKRVR